MNVQQIRIEEYNYPLPDHRIAKYPLAERDNSKLLLYKNGTISHDSFRSLADHLPKESFLVFNNTRVIHARLRFYKETGSEIEIFCLEPHTPHDYALIFQTTSSCRWLCLVGNSKRWKEGELKRTIRVGDEEIVVVVRRLAVGDQASEVEFSWNNPHATFADLLTAMGELPIPPYLNRATQASDEIDYQTIYSKIKGSVAAPTAGLHFTDRTLTSLREHAMTWGELTLHVGAGTFRPVKSEQIKDHKMHAETFSVDLPFLKQLRASLGSVIAVGTTSVRTLESLYYMGREMLQNPEMPPTAFFVDQWTPYTSEQLGNEPNACEAIAALINYLEITNRTRIHGATRIIIAPGYTFRIVRGIITNFHQPKSTLLLLISAYLQGEWRNVYDYALANDFRFLSYGDSSLLLV